MAVRHAAAAAHPGAARIAAGYALAAIGHLRAVRAVAGYLPIRGELDPVPAMLALSGLGYPLCVPEIEAPGHPLRFRAWQPGAATEPGRYGVEVPIGAALVEPDVLLVPLLAFDPRGHRLGYGGGFYDAMLPDFSPPAVAVVVAFDFQLVAELPAEPHDLPCAFVVTDTRMLVASAPPVRSA